MSLALNFVCIQRKESDLSVTWKYGKISCPNQEIEHLPFPPSSAKPFSLPSLPSGFLLLGKQEKGDCFTRLPP